MRVSLLRLPIGLACLAAATAIAQPTPFVPEWRGYDVAAGRELRDVAIGPAVGPNGTLSVFVLLAGDDPARERLRLYRLAPDFSVLPTEVNPGGGIIEQLDTNLSPVCTLEGPPRRNFVVTSPRVGFFFEAVSDDGVNTTFTPLLLTLGQPYGQILCAPDGDSLLILAHNLMSQRVEIWRLTSFPPAMAAIEARPASKAAAFFDLGKEGEFTFVVFAIYGADVTGLSVDAEIALVFLAAGGLNFFQKPHPPPMKSSRSVHLGTGTTCEIDNSASAATLGSSDVVNTYLADGSLLVAYPESGQYRITRIADPVDCTGRTTALTGMATSGTPFARTGAVLLQASANRVRLLATRIQDIDIGPGGVLTPLAMSDLPPAGSGGPRDAIALGSGAPIVAGPAGPTGLRLMGDAINVLNDGFEGG